MHLKWGTVGEGEKGMGRSQYTADQGSEWTGIAPHTKEGFLVSKRGVQGIGVEISKQRGIITRVRRAPPYIMLILYILC
jgi:hypothetical protein